jgi:hypothetical protein
VQHDSCRFVCRRDDDDIVADAKDWAEVIGAPLPATLVDRRDGLWRHPEMTETANPDAGAALIEKSERTTTDPVVAMTELITPRIRERSAEARVLETTQSEDVAIAQDYLRQHQHKSVARLAETVLLSITGRRGRIPPEVVASVAARLSFGRTTGPLNGFEQILKVYCHWIEHICARLKLPLHSGVAAGIVWHPSLVPAQKGVLTTNASIIVIPEWTLMLCHYICKLLSRSMPTEDKSRPGKIGITIAPEVVLAKIRSTPKLRKYAAGFFAFCATHDRRPLRSLKNASGLARPAWIQLLMATELFVIAHEYGHHIALHQTEDGADLKMQELEADHLAALITAHIGAETGLQFAHGGEAGVIALIGNDMVRRARSVLTSGREEPFTSETHPPLKHRLFMLETLRYDAREAEAVRLARQHLAEIMEGLWDLILPDLKKMNARGIRPIPMKEADSQWLPFWG